MAVKRSDFLCTDKIEYMYLRQFKQVLDEYDIRNQQILHFRICTSKCSNSSRVLELSRNSSNFIEPLLPKNQTEQPWSILCCYVAIVFDI
jgi:hypothetical protein